MAVNLRDYTHARKVFRDGGYRLSPKPAYIYYVVFTINPSINTSVDNREISEIGALVKSVTLPGFNIDTQQRNQYGRRTHTHHRIAYNPVTMILHDDQDDVVNEMWDNYYTFFFYDGEKDRNDTSILALRDTYNNARTDVAFGYKTGNQEPFFTDIRIYSLYLGKFTEYVLLRPMISSLQHGTHVASDAAGIMETTLTLEYESVLYNKGNFVLDDTPTGIAFHYDRVNENTFTTSDTRTVRDFEYSESDEPLGQTRFLENVGDNEGVQPVTGVSDNNYTSATSDFDFPASDNTNTINTITEPQAYPTTTANGGIASDNRYYQDTKVNTGAANTVTSEGEELTRLLTAAADRSVRATRFVESRIQQSAQVFGAVIQPEAAGISKSQLVDIVASTENLEGSQSTYQGRWKDNTTNIIDFYSWIPVTGRSSLSKSQNSVVLNDVATR